MNRSNTFRSALLSLASGILASTAVAAGSDDGLWQATAEVGGAQIPFQLEIAGEGASVHAHYAEGLEIVALDFEQQPDQLANPARLRAFIQRYGISYTVLLAGERKDVNAKVPQAVNLNAWPTTFFLGRDGRVKSVHVGFTSPGSGPRDTQTRADIEHEVETLLASR